MVGAVRTEVGTFVKIVSRVVLDGSGPSVETSAGVGTGSAS